MPIPRSFISQCARLAVSGSNTTVNGKRARARNATQCLRRAETLIVKQGFKMTTEISGQLLAELESIETCAKDT